MRFDDKVIIVTGGANGIGRATATLLAEAGADVVIADIDVDAGSRVADSIGAKATFEKTDLRSLDAIESLVAGAEQRFGRIDGLANVAAAFLSASFVDTTPEAWQQVNDVNDRAVFFLGQAVARSMIRKNNGGVIVNVASNVAFRPLPNFSAYAATKGAIVAMSRIMAHELTPHNVRVNVVAPGHTASEHIRRNFSQEQLDQIASTLVGGRWMEPEEVARAIVFLLSDASRGMNGAVLNANLGNYMPH
jgi:NAD(P)-dependent dehydrogenase (short-subunit alcohol dehydrogenase family)